MFEVWNRQDTAGFNHLCTRFYQKGQDSVDMFTGFSFVVIQLLLDLSDLGLQSSLLGDPSLVPVPLFVSVHVLLHFGDLGL